MTLRTYCLRCDKVLNVPSLCSRADDTGSLYGSAVYFYFVSQSGGSVTSLQVLLAKRQVGFHGI